MDCSLPDSSVHGILPARIPEWVAIFCYRGFSWLRDWMCISWGSWVSFKFSSSVFIPLCKKLFQKLSNLASSSPHLFKKKKKKTGCFFLAAVLKIKWKRVCKALTAMPGHTQPPHQYCWWRRCRAVILKPWCAHRSLGNLAKTQIPIKWFWAGTWERPFPANSQVKPWPRDHTVSSQDVKSCLPISSSLDFPSRVLEIMKTSQGNKSSSTAKCQIN